MFLTLNKVACVVRIKYLTNSLLTSTQQTDILSKLIIIMNKETLRANSTNILHNIPHTGAA